MPQLYDRTPSYQERRRAIRRRRVALLTILAAVLTTTGLLLVRTQLGGSASDGAAPTAAATATPAQTTAAPSTAVAGTTAATTTAAATDAADTAPAAAPAHVGRPSDRTRLRLIKSIGGDIAPKSVASSDTGVITAQNMMYRHTVTVYSARTMKLLKTIPDAVVLSKFGVKGHPGTSQGAPVEATFSPDGRYAYVSNYSMYGAGFGPEGSDTCVAGDGTATSYVYRINLE